MRNIYVVRGNERGGLAAYTDYEEALKHATHLGSYTNYGSALAHAKHFVGDEVQVHKSRISPHMTFVYGKWIDAVIEMYPLKEEFDNE